MIEEVPTLYMSIGSNCYRNMYINQETTMSQIGQVSEFQVVPEHEQEFYVQF